MAAITVKLLICCLVFTFLCGVDDVDGRRGGGGGRGGRGGRSWGRTSHATRGVRSYRNVVLSGRIIKGSSPYTSSTWRAAAMGGLIYGGLRYTRRYPHSTRMPPICTNTKEKSPEGRVYGYFICPRDHEPEDYKLCCGSEKREYCCNYTQAQMYYHNHHRERNSTSVVTVIGIIVAVIVLIVIVAFCCKKRKHAGQILRKFSSKKSRDRHEDNDFQAVPLNSTGKQDTRPPVSQPPPAYDISASYPDGPSHIPNGPPQPQPQFGDEKSGLPPPRIDPGTPYPTAPPGAAPYPMADGGAPYPTASAPYPPTAGAPYPLPTAPPYPGNSYPSGPPSSAAFDGGASYPPYPPPGQSQI